jgi:hypothetical protein
MGLNDDGSKLRWVYYGFQFSTFTEKILKYALKSYILARPKYLQNILPPRFKAKIPLKIPSQELNLKISRSNQSDLKI